MALVSGGSYAYLSANAVTGGHLAGAAAASVGAYRVSGLSFRYSQTNPDEIEGVAFDLDHPASVVKLQLVSGGAWYACSQAGAGAWECDTDGGWQATISAGDRRISVVAHD